MPDARRLVEGSLNGFNTLDVTIVEWHDAELLRRAWTSRGEDMSTWTVARAIPNPASRHGVTERTENGMRRVRWRKPDHWRADVYLGGELLAVNVCRGTIASSYGAVHRLMATNDPSVQGRRPWPLARVPAFGLPSLESELSQIPLFALPFRDAGWDVDLTGDAEELLGRPTISVVARRSRQDGDASDFRWGAFDRFVAVFDAERGLPLRLAGLVEGCEAACYAVQSVRFDESISDEVFLFAPPEGTKVVKATNS